MHIYVGNPAGDGRYVDVLSIFDSAKRCMVIGSIERKLPVHDHAKAYRAAVGLMQDAVRSKWQESWRVCAYSYPSPTEEAGAATYITICERNRLARRKSRHYRSAQP